MAFSLSKLIIFCICFFLYFTITTLCFGFFSIFLPDTILSLQLFNLFIYFAPIILFFLPYVIITALKTNEKITPVSARNSYIILAFFICVVLVSGIIKLQAHEHEWVNATCTEPKTCIDCNKTEGESLGHQWNDATCQVPKTCIICGETYGVSSPHNWIKATCTKPKTCILCAATKGEALGHTRYQLDWFTSKRPTCQSEGIQKNICRRCGNTELNSIPVVSCVAGGWQTVIEDSTSTLIVKAQYCYMCGKEMDRKQIKLSGSNDNGNTSSPSGDAGNGNNFNTYNNENQQNTTASYVLNSSTMKFHRPSCRDVPKISPSNYATSNQPRSDLISSGYSACGHCNP